MEAQGSFLTVVMDFIKMNIAYLLLGVGVLYFVVLVVSIVNARRSGNTVTVSLKLAVPFAIIIGLGVYCLVTGQNLNSFIG